MKQFFYFLAALGIIMLISSFWEAVSDGGVSWQYDGQTHNLKLTGL